MTVGLICRINVSSLRLKQVKTMIYLIGGAPCTGKTTVAQALSKKLDIPILSTDVVRGWMQHLLVKEEFPALFHAVGMTAHEYLTKNTSQQIIEKEKSQLKIVARGIISFILANYEWQSYIIEGTGVTPELIESVKKIHRDISSVVLIENDKKRLRESIFKRGLWGEPETYANELKELEVEWVIQFNNWMKLESQERGIAHIIIDNYDSLTSKVFQLFLI